MMAGRAFSTSAAVSVGKVGFIGLGNMGAHMAANLIKAGHDVTVFDLNLEAVNHLEGLGATAAPTARAVGESHPTHVVTMLPNSPIVSGTILGDEGILSALKPGTVIIDSSTIDPSVSRELACAAAERDVGFYYLHIPQSNTSCCLARNNR